MLSRSEIYSVDNQKYWNKLWQNVNMSAKYGAAGARELKKTTLKKSHEVLLTTEDLKDKWVEQDGKCYWLGIEMSLEDLMISRSPFAVSVDRLDSQGEYTKDNIVLTTRFANLGRGAYDAPDFKDRLTGLLQNRK